jgi:hypothetical protein
LPIDASYHSTLTRSPRVKPLTCLTTSFIQHHQKKTNQKNEYKESLNSQVYQLVNCKLGIISQLNRFLLFFHSFYLPNLKRI